MGKSITAYAKEFVSHGYIVFAIDHLDGSCGHTELKDGTPHLLDISKELHDYDLKRIMIKKREEEMIALIDEIIKPKFL